MKTRFFILLISLCLFAATDGLQAQKKQADRAANRAENRANQKVNNKVDNTVDGAVDDAFNAIGGLFKKKDKKKKKKKGSGAMEPDNGTEAGTMDAEEQAAYESTAGGLGNLFGGEWEPYSNPRSFSMVMNMTSTKNRNGKQEKMTMAFAVLENESGVEVNSTDDFEKTRMILNTQTGKSTIITTDKKGATTGYRMRMPNMQKAIEKEMAKQQENITERYTIEATGERMVIDGYNCEKIVVTDTESGDVTTSWVTQDIDLTVVEMSQGLAGAYGGGQIKMPTMPNGKAFEGLFIKSTTVTSKETIEMHITNIKLDGATDKSVFDVSGVQITETGF